MPSKILENISLYCLISLANFRLLFNLSLIRSSTTRGPVLILSNAEQNSRAFTDLLPSGRLGRVSNDVIWRQWRQCKVGISGGIHHKIKTPVPSL